MARPRGQTKEQAARWFIENSRKADSGCVEWTGRINNSGYGLVQFCGKTKLLHRLVLSAFKGEPPESDSQCRHSCNNKVCINPDHLSWGSCRDNSIDDLYIGRRHRQMRLTPEQALDIKRRLDSGEKVGKLATEYKIATSTISRIRSGERWYHVTNPKEATSRELSQSL